MNTISSSAKQFLHYNPDRTDYSLTPEELARLESAGSNLWKDFCLLSGSMGVPCVINAFALTPDPFNLTIVLFLNYLFGVLGVVLCVAFGIAWFKSARQFSSIIQQIKSKPKMEIIPSTTNIGSLSVSQSADANQVVTLD